MQLQAKKENQEAKEAKRQPLSERIRAKLHERVYGDLPNNEKKPDEVKKEWFLGIKHLFNKLN